MNFGSSLNEHVALRPGSYPNGQAFCYLGVGLGATRQVLFLSEQSIAPQDAHHPLICLSPCTPFRVVAAISEKIQPCSIQQAGMTNLGLVDESECSALEKDMFFSKL